MKHKHCPIAGFSWITDDFLGISFLNNINISPQFVDFDGNGVVDLMFFQEQTSHGKLQKFSMR